MIAPTPVKPDLADDLAAGLSAANVMACLQCRKCTDGCPVAARADFKPHELVRMVQFGQRAEVLASRMIWECMSCQTCITRCPQQVNIAAMNDTLRRISRAEGKSGNTAVAAFDDAFLNGVRRRGRLYEIGLMAAFKLRTRRFFQDVDKLPMMLRKGKLPLLPKSVPGRAEREAMFQRIAQAGGKK
ncbi:MAG: 4Fe-4S dicluster domain-containing protein [Tepidisphaeraceae bacterium]